MNSLQSIKPSVIPDNLNRDLPSPETPWLISKRVFESLESPPSSVSYKKAQVLPEDKEWRFIWRYFHADKPNRYGLKRIWCIHERHQQQMFELNLPSQEKEAETFPPTWEGEPRVEQRAIVVTRWMQATAPFSPFQYQEADGRIRVWEHTKILPLWHGTREDICESICNSGFVYFGKTNLGVQSSGDPKSTDEGFFGSGIYFTNSPRYAADIYSKGHMLLAWVSMRHPFPVVGDPQQSDMAILKGGGAYKSYNAHYVPVVPSKDDPFCALYYPAQPGEDPICDEYVVFHKSQTLPRYWIELEVEVPYLITLSDVPQFVEQFIPHIKHFLQNSDVDRDLKLRNVLNKELGFLLKLSNDEDLSDQQIELYHHLTQLIVQGKINKIARDAIVGIKPAQMIHQSHQPYAVPIHRGLQPSHASSSSSSYPNSSPLILEENFDLPQPSLIPSRDSEESIKSHYLFTPILLEQNLMKLTQGPSDFHRYVHILKQDPANKALVVQLYPAEVLCQSNQRLKEYKNSSLNPQHRLFKPIGKIITLLQNASFSSEESQKAVQKIIEYYQSYIDAVCQKTGKERMALLKGPAYLLGVGEETFILDRKMALDLISLDRYGESAKSNAYGSSAVKKVEDVYCKRVAGMNPLCPGMEFTVDSFNKLVVEEGSTPTQLMKIVGIWVKALFDESNRSHESRALLAQERALGLSMEAFFIKYPNLKESYPFKEKRISQIAQASHPIEGMNLLEFIQNPLNLSRFDSYNFSAMNFLGICTTPSDGRSDNYIVPKKGAATFEAVGVDIDQSFTPIFFKREGQHYLNLRYIFFLLPQMNDSIDFHFRKRLEKIHPEFLLLEWLSLLEKKNGFYHKLLKEEMLNSFEFEDLGLPISLSFTSIQRIHRIFLQAKTFVKDYPHCTNWDLLYHVYPHLALIYRKLLNDYQGDVLAAQNKLFDRSVDPISCESFLGEMNPHAPPPCEEDEMKSLQPVELLLQWIETLTFSSAKEQERFLNKLFLLFPDLRTLKLSHCILEDRSFVEIFSRSTNLQELQIDEFSHLKSAGIFPILQQHPHLHLILGDKHNFRWEDIVSLIRYSWDRNRKLSFQLDRETFSFKKENLDVDLFKMLQKKHLLYANVLHSLGANICQKNGSGNNLLHQLADSSLEVLQFLLSQGVLPNEKNNRGETPLHLVVQHGYVENVKCLIQAGASLEARELNGKTPLHAAVIANQEPTVEYLLKQGADLKAFSSQKENVLHFAAFYGHVSLSEFLLSYIEDMEKKEPSSSSLGNRRIHSKLNQFLNAMDEDGKTPLHKAVWGDPKSEIVKLILKQEVNPNVENHYGFTPLHWAAKHGHLESARLLIDAGATLYVVNHNGDTPMDLALKWGQDEIVRFFINSRNIPDRQQIDVKKKSQDIEKDFFRWFEEACDSEKPLEQLFYLEKLGDFYLNQQNYIMAAHLMNGAFYIASKNNLDMMYQKLIMVKLERIEGYFCESLGIKVPNSHRGMIQTYREYLKDVRRQARSQLEAGEAIDNIQKEITKKIIELTSKLIEDCMALLPTAPPTSYAVMGFGSMCCEEMMPYSGIKFAFILKEDTEKNREYFRQLSRLVEIKMINLGETKYPLIGLRKAEDEMREAESLISSGFSIDREGLCPQGKKGVYELIGDVQALAAFQDPKWLQTYKNEKILVDNLRNGILILGDAQLCKRYQEKVQQILDKGGMLKDKLRKTRALDFLQTDLEEFQPLLLEDGNSFTDFDINKDCFNPLQMVIQHILLYYGAKSRGTLAGIQWLKKKKLIQSETEIRLSHALKLISKLRIQAQFFYQKDKEILYHSKDKQNSFQGELFFMRDEEKKMVREIDQALIPFQAFIRTFIDRKIKKLGIK